MRRCGGSRIYVRLAGRARRHKHMYALTCVFAREVIDLVSIYVLNNTQRPSVPLTCAIHADSGVQNGGGNWNSCALLQEGYIDDWRRGDTSFTHRRGKQGQHLERWDLIRIGICTLLSHGVAELCRATAASHMVVRHLRYDKG